MTTSPKKVSYDEALAYVKEQLHQTYLAHTFICSVCGKTVEPIIKVWGGEVFFWSSNNKTTGGIGNKVIKKNVCDDCLKEINLGLNLSNSEVELS